MAKHHAGSSAVLSSGPAVQLRPHNFVVTCIASQKKFALGYEYDITYLLRFQILQSFEASVSTGVSSVQRLFLFVAFSYLDKKNDNLEMLQGIACYWRDVGQRKEWKFDKTESDSLITPLT